LIALTRWVRLRLRAALWRQWKTPRRRRAALIALGVSGELRNTAGSGRGPWHLARSKALSVGLSNATPAAAATSAGVRRSMFMHIQEQQTGGVCPNARENGQNQPLDHRSGFPRCR